MTQWNGAPATVAQLEALVLSGYGSYTFFQSRAHSTRGLALHLQRLRDDAIALFGQAPPDQQLRAWIARAVPMDPCSVRVTLMSADHAAVLAGTALVPDVVVSTGPPRPADPPPLSVRTTTYVRDTPQVKHRATHGPSRETRAARQAGFDDALLLAPDGTITEGTTWNLLLHDGEQWVWPSAPMLPGVTAALLRAAMDEAGIGHRTASVRVADLPLHRAAFALNSSCPDRPVVAFDGQRLRGSETAASELRQLWASVVPEPLA